MTDTGRTASVTIRDVYEQVRAMELNLSERLTRVETLAQGSERRFEMLEGRTSEQDARLDRLENRQNWMLGIGIALATLAGVLADPLLTALGWA